MYFVYILQNPTGRFYVGQTGNLEARLIDHNRLDSFEGHYTRKNGPWKLVWYEEHSSRSSAVLRERQIKAMKSAQWIRKSISAPKGLRPKAQGCRLGQPWEVEHQSSTTATRLRPDRDGCGQVFEARSQPR